MESNLDTRKAYVRKYGTYSSSVHRSRLVMLIAESFLTEYPDKLSPEVRNLTYAFEKLLSGGQTSGTAGTDSTKQTEAAVGTPSTEQKMDITDETRSILTATFGLMIFQRGGDEPKFDFTRTVYSNEVVMQTAYLNGFVRATIAEICRLRPELLKRAEKVGSTIRERVNWLEKIGIDLKVAETQVAWLEEAENVRHIIVHNGGRVDNQFLRRTGRTDLPIGEPFPLSSHYLLRVYTGSKALAAALFTGVAEKFFGLELPKQSTSDG